MSIYPSSIICDLHEMDQLAATLAKKLKPSDVITLSGKLGSGKTTFSKFLCKHLGIASVVSSPTFTYLNIYDDKVAHFDLYRLKSKENFFELGFEEYLESTFITLIEWPELIEDSLGSSAIKINFIHHENKREVSFYDELLV